jgi:hypothetical protein
VIYSVCSSQQTSPSLLKTYFFKSSNKQRFKNAHKRHVRRVSSFRFEMGQIRYGASVKNASLLLTKVPTMAPSSSLGFVWVTSWLLGTLYIVSCVSVWRSRARERPLANDLCPIPAKTFVTLTTRCSRSRILRPIPVKSVERFPSALVEWKCLHNGENGCCGEPG